MLNCQQQGASENLVLLVATADRMHCQVWCVVEWPRPAAKHPQFAHSFPSHSGNGKKIGRTRMRKLMYQNKDHSPITEVVMADSSWGIKFKTFNYWFGVWETKMTNILTLREDTFSLPLTGSTSLQTPLLPAPQSPLPFLSLHLALISDSEVTDEAAPGASV